MTEIIELPRWQGYIEKEIGLVMPKRQNRWVYNAILELAKTNNLSIDELWQAVLLKADGNAQAVGRAHIAKVLYERGIVKTMQQAFDKYLADNKPAYVAIETLSTPFSKLLLYCLNTSSSSTYAFQKSSL